ncbi:toxin-antitoxin system HicB family antitoxin [Terriglobus sp. RCC_193]|uniref:toxin-antitoxin system HicB family antitoxin n=1 Tax=Terriglobus sp. RCC_193 TaxID=3239218 RepID=UPI0035239C87
MESPRHENIPVRIALSLRQQAEELAHQQGISLNHFVTQALEEKIVRMQNPPLAAFANRLRSAG